MISKIGLIAAGLAGLSLGIANNGHADIWDGTSKKLAMGQNVLVEGNPLDDIKIIENYDHNFKVIMKDGKIWKNALNQAESK